MSVFSRSSGKHIFPTNDSAPRWSVSVTLACKTIEDVIGQGFLAHSCITKRQLNQHYGLFDCHINKLFSQIYFCDMQRLLDLQIQYSQYHQRRALHLVELVWLSLEILEMREDPYFW